MATTRTLGGRRVKSKPGARSVSITSDKIVVDMTPNRARRQIAAAMKNEIQAGIRAITVPASNQTLAIREAKRSGRETTAWIAASDRLLAGKKKKRARKHLGKGTFANDTGGLADRLWIKFARVAEFQEAFLLNAPMDRLNPITFGGKAKTDKYAEFRSKLLQYVQVLGDPSALWDRPRVQAAVARVQKEMTKVIKRKLS